MSWETPPPPPLDELDRTVSEIEARVLCGTGLVDSAATHRAEKRRDDRRAP